VDERLLEICLADAYKYLIYKEFAYPHRDSDLARKYWRQPWGEVPAREILNFLKAKETKGIPWACGYSHTKGVTADTSFTREIADYRLKEVILESIRDASDLVPNFKDQPAEVQATLVFLTRELGRVGVYGFRTTLKHCTNRNYPEMARALEKSLWYSQSPRKAKYLIKRLKEI